MNQLKWARYYAKVNHAGQEYSGLPYTHHLYAVEQVLRRYMPQLIVEDPLLLLQPALSLESSGLRINKDEWPESLYIAAWLHDIVEDTEVKVKDIREFFGDRIARLVEAVTNVANPDRKVRMALTYPKIRKEKYAVVLKLADRIANMEAGGSQIKRYKQEYEDFRRALYTQGEAGQCMWDHLDKLAEYKL